jgi:hypothetical protein
MVCWSSLERVLNFTFEAQVHIDHVNIALYHVMHHWNPVTSIPTTITFTTADASTQLTAEHDLHTNSYQSHVIKLGPLNISASALSMLIKHDPMPLGINGFGTKGDSMPLSQKICLSEVMFLDKPRQKICQKGHYPLNFNCHQAVCTKSIAIEVSWAPSPGPKATLSAFRVYVYGASAWGLGWSMRPVGPPRRGQTC